jgi:predicted outer membrane repeat protein
LNQVSPGIYEGIIEYATTSNMDLVKNTRFTEYPRPITMYSSTGEIKEKYIHMHEAVEAAEDGDVIKVRGGSVLHESTQSYITNKELTITSENGMYTLDYTGAATMAFYLTGTASLTIENAVVQNVCTTDQYGGAFYGGLFTNLTIKNTVIGTNTTVNGKGGGVYFMGNKFILEESTITNNSAQDGGGVYLSTNNATITDCTFLGNHSTGSGGAVYNKKNLYFYNNSLDSNTADIDGNGLFIKTNAFVYNSEGEQWRHFNAPDCPVNIIENTEMAENIYKSQGSDEGSAIMHEETKESTLGRLSLSPSIGTEGERQNIDIVYTLGTFFNGGSVKFHNDINFPITDTASVTIGDASPVNASTYSPNSNIITITGVNGDENTTVTLSILATIPPASTAARDKSYRFSALSDPDGSGGAWEYSDFWPSTFTSESKD